MGLYRQEVLAEGKKEEVKKKKLPRPGIEPGSLRPQLSVLTIRPPKRHLPLYSFARRLSYCSRGSINFSPKLTVLQF